MVPFDYQPRTHVVFGQGTLGRLGTAARDLGFRRTLIVADRGPVETGLVEAATALLNAAGVHVATFHDFGPAPDSRMVDAGREHAAALGVDSIVALGGGSSINYAKALNFVLTNGGVIADYHGEGRTSTPLLPTIAVPTTAGTGAEAHSYAIVADAESRLTLFCRNPGAAARVAILDPELSSESPHHISAMAGFDAIANSVETAVAVRRTPMSDMFSHQAWRLVTTSFDRVLLHPADIEARAAMLVAAHFAGMAVEQSMVGAADACARALTAQHTIAHGLALAILLPHVVRWNGDVAGDRYAALIGSPRRRARDEAPAESLARHLEDLAEAGGLAMTLGDAGVDERSLPELAAVAAREWTGAFNPRPFDAAGALEIYRAAYRSA